MGFFFQNRTKNKTMNKNIKDTDITANAAKIILEIMGETHPSPNSSEKTSQKEPTLNIISNKKDPKDKISDFLQILEIYGFISQKKLNVHDYYNEADGCINLKTNFSYAYDDSIVLPSKMDLFKDLSITEKDNIFVRSENKGHKINFNQFCKHVLLINGDNTLVGIFQLKCFLVNGTPDYRLIAAASNIILDNHQSSKYYFIFRILKCNSNSRSCNIAVPIEVVLHDTETTNTHLCIDFGTSNTTAGCYIDNQYVSNFSNLATSHGFLTLNKENLVQFNTQNREELKYSPLFPSVVYVKNITPDGIEYAFGYEASELIKDNGYCPEASCFMEIKRWTSDIEKIEDIQDHNGNKAKVSRKDILSNYLMFVISEAENQFKCKFKNIHISAPVKLKNKVISIYDKILSEKGYNLEKVHAIDEGVSVLYSIIHNKINQKTYEDNKLQKVLIIDCGGGTSDLASCAYKIHKDEDGIINLDISTEYMNGDVNYGGNNITYRIMQFMKIVYARKFQKKDRLTADDLISEDSGSIFSYIEGNDMDEEKTTVNERYNQIYEKFNQEYQKAEEIIPTRFIEYENSTADDYKRIKNNFYFLWKLAEEMKKEFYRTNSISRVRFDKDANKQNDVDLHVKQIDEWKLSVRSNSNGELSYQAYPYDITFNAKEIDKLIRADIYYLVRKFLNDLYNNEDENSNLTSFNQIKLSGQSSKINIFMESLKEFLPGKKIGRSTSKSKDVEELKLMCIRGAILYLRNLEKSDLEINLHNDTQNIPISVYITLPNGEQKEMITDGKEWKQPAKRGRITSGAKYIELFMKYSDKTQCKNYKFPCENIEWYQTNAKDIENLSNNLISQNQLDELVVGKKYYFVYLNKTKWGFCILPVYPGEHGTLFKGKEEFCSFEMDDLQETFFDGRK